MSENDMIRFDLIRAGLVGEGKQITSVLAITCHTHDQTFPVGEQCSVCAKGRIIGTERVPQRQHFSDAARKAFAGTANAMDDYELMLRARDCMLVTVEEWDDGPQDKDMRMINALRSQLSATQAELEQERKRSAALRNDNERLHALHDYQHERVKNADAGIEAMQDELDRLRRGLKDYGPAYVALQEVMRKVGT